MNFRSALAALIVLGALVPAAPATSKDGAPSVTVRTEQYPRPPYSGATYYVYEMRGTTVCTKLEVCNKFGECQVSYHRGAFKAPEDQETGEPYGATPAAAIGATKIRKHVCLVRYTVGGA